MSINGGSQKGAIPQTGRQPTETHTSAFTQRRSNGGVLHPMHDPKGTAGRQIEQQKNVRVQDLQVVDLEGWWWSA
jgi:hypothetical protein